MIRPIGEIFEFNGVKLEVVKNDGDTCEGCYFENIICGNCEDVNVTGYCSGERESVIFKEVK